jgi:hypothetical protein
MMYTSPREFCVISKYEVVMTMVSVLCFDGISRYGRRLFVDAVAILPSRDLVYSEIVCAGALV